MKKTNRPSGARRGSKLAERAMSWMLLATVLLGGVRMHQKNRDKEDDTEKPKTEQVEIITTPPVQKAGHVIDSFKLNPQASDAEWEKQLAAIHPYVMAETIFSEGFAEEMYLDKNANSGYWTIGSGYMLGMFAPNGTRAQQMIKERREFFHKVLGRWPEGTKITYAENQKLMTAWYRTYVYPAMRKAFKKPVGAGLFIELAIAAYNRGQGIYSGKVGSDITKSINSGKSEADIVNQFYSLLKAGNGGLAPKYAVAGHRVLGNVSDADILNTLANAVYKVSPNVRMWDAKGHLKKEYADKVSDILLGIKDADFERVVWGGKDKKGRVIKKWRVFKQQKVRDYLTPAQVQTILAGELFDAKSMDDIYQRKVVSKNVTADTAQKTKAKTQKKADKQTKKKTDKKAPAKKKTTSKKKANKPVQEKADKKKSFKKGSKKLRNSAYSAGFDLSKLLFGGHDNR